MGCIIMQVLLAGQIPIIGCIIIHVLLSGHAPVMGSIIIQVPLAGHVPIIDWDIMQVMLFGQAFIMVSHSLLMHWPIIFPIMLPCPIMFPCPIIFPAIGLIKAINNNMHASSGTDAFLIPDLTIPIISNLYFEIFKW